MITKFSTVYAGHVDLGDMGQLATPANERRYSTEHLASVFEKTEAIARRCSFMYHAPITPVRGGAPPVVPTNPKRRDRAERRVSCELRGHLAPAVVHLVSALLNAKSGQKRARGERGR